MSTSIYCFIVLKCEDVVMFLLSKHTKEQIKMLKFGG